MNAVAFALGLISLGLVKADVSHLRPNQFQRNSMFVANNGQVVKQSFNSNGDATYSSRSYTNNAGNDANSKSRYWWMDTESLPFTKQNNINKENYFSAGCDGCASRTLNIKHNTQQHATQQDAYSQNPFMNVKHNPSVPLFNRIRSAPVSGSPQEVNNFFQPQQTFESGRVQQSSSCADSSSACVAPKFCFNGFVDQSAAHKAQISAVSLSCFVCFFCGDIARDTIDRMNVFRRQPTDKLNTRKKHETKRLPSEKFSFFQFGFFLMSNKTIKVG